MRSADSAASEQSRRDRALAFLYSRIDYERAVFVPYDQRRFKLDRMRDFLAQLGNPHRGLPIVHVAGTKGKGSTAAMLASVLSAAGFRTGLYSSPHLDRPEERLVVDGQSCTAEDFVELIDLVRPAVEELDLSARHAARSSMGPTFFELATAMALLHFARRRVDLAVLEVGLGGRLDSTNVCWPLVSIITSISFDHMKQLGHTLSAIAREKAGIIKPGVGVVSGVSDVEPHRAISEVCQLQGSRLFRIGDDFDISYRPPHGLEQADVRGRIDYELRTGDRPWLLRDVELGLLGRHQAANAGVAITALFELSRRGWRVNERAIRKGLSEVYWPARIEVVARRPTVVVDTAHNVASVEALITTLDESFSARRRVLVFGTSQDKEAAPMLKRLLPRFDRVVLTRYRNNLRGFPIEDLAGLAREVGHPCCETSPDPESAWRLASSQIAEDDLICVTGSFFLAAEIRRHIG